MKKRKELDALMSPPPTTTTTTHCNGHVIGKMKIGNGPRSNRKKKRNSSGSGGSTGTELLASDRSRCHDDRSSSDETTDVEEYSVLNRTNQLRGHFGKKCCPWSCICGQCFPICTMILVLVAVCLVGSGILIWMQLGIQQELDLLRDHIRKVEEGSKGTPVEFHGIHSKLKELQNNQSALRNDVIIVNETLDTITKEITALKVGVTDLKKSLAETPELETLPKDFKELQSRLVSMGSKITDFESNLALVQNQLTSTDKVNQNLNGQLEALRQKVDSLAAMQHTTTNDASQQVFAYVDAEVKKLDDMVVDVNASVWDKLQWAVDDLHEHHKMITGLQSTVQNVSHFMAMMESNASDSLLASNWTLLLNQPQFREVIEHVLDDIGSSSLRNVSMTSLLDRNQSTIGLPTVLDFMRNATRLYVALLVNADRLGGFTVPLTSNATVDLNVTSVLHDTIDASVKSATDEQRAQLSGLNATVVNLLTSWNSSRQDYASVSDKLIALQNQVNQLLSTLRSKGNVPAEGSPATTTSSASDTTMTTTMATTTATTVGPSLATSQVDLQAQANANGSSSNSSSSSGITGNVSDAVVSPTMATVVDTNGTTLPDKVFKPKHTGGTLEDPQQRKPEDTDTDRR